MDFIFKNMNDIMKEPSLILKSERGIIWKERKNLFTSSSVLVISL